MDNKNFTGWDLIVAILMGLILGVMLYSILP